MYKKLIVGTGLMIGMVLLPHRSDAQILDIISIINTAVKKVIVAADLEVERLQNQTIGLQSAQKELENAMQSSELGDITNWVQQQKDLFSEFYQELWNVKVALSAYTRVKDMIEKQVRIVSECRQVSSVIGQDKHFSAAELTYLKSVLSGIINQSVLNLNQLYRVVNAFMTQMDDADRLTIINEAGNGIDKNGTDLEVFSQQTELLSLQRSKDANEIAATKMLYGIK
jgi:hypothetical protein